MVGAGGSLGFRLGTGILKRPCAAHQIDQPLPNFGRSAERPSPAGVIIFVLPSDPETST
jgi:hypothetical protein